MESWMLGIQRGEESGGEGGRRKGKRERDLTTSAKVFTSGLERCHNLLSNSVSWSRLRESKRGGGGEEGEEGKLKPLKSPPTITSLLPPPSILPE
jgi:hypothetical protein